MSLLRALPFLAVPAVATADVTAAPPSLAAWDPGLLLALALAAALWLRGSARRPLRRRRLAAGLAGAVAVAAAVASPLDAWAGLLLSAHMVQHLLLVLVAAPLLVLARPLGPFLAGLPGAVRLPSRRALRSRPVRAVARFAVHPLPALALHLGALWVWHAPALYEAALASGWLHALEHASFLGTAVLWFEGLRRAGTAAGMNRGLAVLSIFAAAVGSSVLGALLAVAPEPLYPTHAAGAVALGRHPLVDQRLAGVVMWVPAGLVYLALALGMLHGLLRAPGPGTGRIGAPGGRPKLLAALLAALALGGCESFRDRPPRRQVSGGDPDRGRLALVRYGCGGCHFVPGVPEAVSWVAPPLHNYGDRAFVAGILSNNAENLIAWIRRPRELDPRTAMPDLGVTEGDARDIAAFLYTLRASREGLLR